MTRAYEPDIPEPSSCVTNSRMWLGWNVPSGRGPIFGKACSRSWDLIEALVFGSPLWLAIHFSPNSWKVMRVVLGSMY